MDRYGYLAGHTAGHTRINQAAPPYPFLVTSLDLEFPMHETLKQMGTSTATSRRRSASAAKRQKTRERFVLLFLLGSILKITTALAPIHEVGHWMFAVTEGVDAEITDWSHTRIAQHTPANLYGGHRFDLAFWGILGLLGAYSRKHGLAGFGYGVAHMTFLKAFVSDDFTVLIEAIGYDVGQGLVIWGIIGVVVLSVMWVVRVKANESDQAEAEYAREVEQRLARKAEAGP